MRGPLARAMIVNLLALLLTLPALASAQEGQQGSTEPPAAEEPGGGEGEEPGGGAGEGGDGGEEPEAPPEPTGLSLEEIRIAASSEIGLYLVDQNGLALYVFLADEQGESTCYEECAQAWAPVVIEAEGDLPVLGEGVDPDLLATLPRRNGRLQLTYNGWPLYYYMGDLEPGVYEGHGEEGRWFVISPEGDPLGPEVGDEGEDGASGAP